MKIKTSMLIEKFHEEPDGIGGFIHAWSPIDTVSGVFCQDEYCYKFIYKYSKEVSERDRFRLGNRHFEIKNIAPSTKEQWKVARLQECV